MSEKVRKPLGVAEIAALTEEEARNLAKLRGEMRALFQEYEAAREAVWQYENKLQDRHRFNPL